MSATVQHRETFRLCGGSKLELALRLTPTPVGDDFVSEERRHVAQPTYPLDLMLCSDCGNVQLLNVVNPEIIYREYTYTSSISLGLIEHFNQYAESVLRQANPPEGSLIIELGSNEGAMLRAFKSRGYRTLGIDPAREIARHATESGIETLPTYFTAELARTIRDERGPAAIMIANNVLANIDDVSDVAAGIRTLLSPDGLFVFETSYRLDVVEKALIDTIFHEHLTYFSVKPLVSFFSPHGMELVDVERVATKGGSLRGVVQLAGRHQRLSPSVAQLVACETKCGLDRPETYQNLESRLSHMKNDLRALLENLKAQRKTIAAYGAAVGLTTMIYHFDLGELVSFIVDDNPGKQNTYSPGLHIPTLPSEALYERKPDYVVILAWRYAEAIRKKHQRYLEAGGHFIIPLPDIWII